MVGSSAGTIVGAAYASGLPPPWLLSATRDLRLASLIDLSPAGGLVRGKHFEVAHKPIQEHTIRYAATPPLPPISTVAARFCWGTERPARPRRPMHPWRCRCRSIRRHRDVGTDGEGLGETSMHWLERQTVLPVLSPDTHSANAAMLRRIKTALPQAFAAACWHWTAMQRERSVTGGSQVQVSARMPS